MLTLKLPRGLILLSFKHLTRQEQVRTTKPPETKFITHHYGPVRFTKCTLSLLRDEKDKVGVGLVSAEVMWREGKTGRLRRDGKPKKVTPGKETWRKVSLARCFNHLKGKPDAFTYDEREAIWRTYLSRGVEVVEAMEVKAPLLLLPPAPPEVEAALLVEASKSMPPWPPRHGQPVVH